MLRQAEDSIVDNAALLVWLQKLRCPETFEAFDQLPPYEMFVLDFWTHTYNRTTKDPVTLVETSETVKSHAFVFSSPAVLRNLARAVEGKKGMIDIMVDGTYRLSKEGWVLTDIGTTGLRFYRGGLAPPLLPLSVLALPDGECQLPDVCLPGPGACC